MTIFEIISWIATSLSIAMFAPQTYKAIKTKSVSDLSFTTYLIMFISCMCWSIYGSLIQSYPASATNITITLLLLPILFLFNKGKKVFISLACIDFCVITTSILFFVFDIEIHLVIKVILVILAGGASGFGFVPQIIKTIKIKEYGDGSWLSIALIMISNGFWIVYWVDADIHASASDLPSMILATFFTASTLICQIPLLIYKYIGNKHK